MANVADHKKCISLCNQSFIKNHVFIALNPGEYNQGLCYYPFTINLDNYNEICNTLDDLSGRICISNKTEDMNSSGFIMITKTNESKTLTKYISCQCKSKFDDRKCNSNHKWNNDECWCDCENLRKHMWEKDDFAILVHAFVKMVNTLEVLLVIQ